ncbi:glycoside hydrolase family 13 protein [Affinibrenneria salicis]|uniref:Glycoside hydrolase family 13 protein n=1 Tax=Affinibrenneria salicis TaxID=2590031 RepID=A0A5J5FUB8_9GAMM|nr:glycoside hydrolase family 13 protein [Affinibrenneria salicis]KAA8996867.1 glycoside hydrolase family 13 protein [Affinibrenneria salicis]
MKNSSSASRVNPAEQPWWKSAVIYQIYPRSFADANGDGTGDLPGITDKLPWLSRLGIDAIWLSPFYRSPQKDAGYDVADYCDVDPLFGTLDDFDRMLTKAHDLGLRIIIDLVPNHTSSAHPWFQAAMRAAPGSPERERYIFRDGKGPDGDEPPNNWKSVFGGGAWSRLPGDRQWYLHLFDSSQPDLNWDNPLVRQEFEAILRFWLQRGVDGFRVDVAHGMVKAAGLPDTREEDAGQSGINVGPMWDQEGVHEIYRSWNKILREFPGQRMMVAEAWVHPQSHLAHYIRPDEMQQAFNFDFLLASWRADRLKSVIDSSLAACAVVDGSCTWVLSNHDVVRHASRYGLPQDGKRLSGLNAQSPQPDEALGLRRARAAALLVQALPGSAYIYQGEELGLPEHTTLEDSYRQDPSFFRTDGATIGRDGCRIPLPWRHDAPGYGFSPTGKSWLPQPASFARYSADVQEGASDSTLELYRQLLKARRDYQPGQGRLVWEPSADGVLQFRNGALRVVVNLSQTTIALPAGEPIIASGQLPPGAGLAPDSAVWLKV